MANYRFLLLFALLFCSSCSMSRSVIGRYEAHSPLASIGLTIAADSSFDYKFTGEGTGRKRWSCGAWRPAGTNKLFLSSIHHNRLPIHIRADGCRGGNCHSPSPGCCLGDKCDYTNQRLFVCNSQRSDDVFAAILPESRNHFDSRLPR